MCSTFFSITALGLDCLMVPCPLAIGAINGRETEILTADQRARGGCCAWSLSTVL